MESGCSSARMASGNEGRGLFQRSNTRIKDTLFVVFYIGDIYIYIYICSRPRAPPPQPPPPPLYGGVGWWGGGVVGWLGWFGVGLGLVGWFRVGSGLVCGGFRVGLGFGLI